MITPDHWQDDYEIYRGATFNLSHDLGQMLHMRPHNRFEDLEGVYLVGGGTHPGSGLPVIYSSARITSQLLLQDLGVVATSNAPSRKKSAAIYAEESAASVSSAVRHDSHDAHDSHGLSLGHPSTTPTLT